ncbi:hypothetical protein B0H19DRAFT_1105346 [Mycena capillaripes]|nr:hypothetical protein B0H19DRAFT_1105346 [Mycena capillaripes]
MFSLRSPRRRLPGSSIPPASSSSHPINDIYETDEHFAAQSSSNRPFESVSSAGGWSFSASTLIDGAGAPSWASRAASPPTRRSYRHSTPVHHAFSCEIPEDPLRAAIGLENVLEHPLSRPQDTSVESAEAHSLLDFSRCQVGSIKPHKSALSALVTSPSVPNPFTGVAPVTGGPLNIKVYFPRAKQPSGHLLDLSLPGDATIEEAIALALWKYWEKHWLPKLDPSRTRDTDPASWIMLVPGKDGVINKRIAQHKIVHFKFDKYAIVRAPRNLAEKKKVEKQVSEFRLAPPPPTLDNKRHPRARSLPSMPASKPPISFAIVSSTLSRCPEETINDEHPEL